MNHLAGCSLITICDIYENKKTYFHARHHISSIHLRTLFKKYKKILNYISGADRPMVVCTNIWSMIVLIIICASLLLYQPLTSGKWRGLLGKLVSAAVVFPVDVLARDVNKLILQYINIIQNVPESVCVAFCYIVEPINDNLWVAKNMYMHAIVPQCKVQEMTKRDDLSKIVCARSQSQFDFVEMLIIYEE